MKKLIIDTHDTLITRVSLDTDGKRIDKEAPLGVKKSQMVLPLIEEILAENSLKLQDITNIQVHTGPGSFTGLRVGVTVAATLSWALEIPINTLHPGTIPEIIYKDSKF